MSSFDPSIQESHLAHPDYMALQDGRMVSTTFLWHFSICNRVLTNVKKPLRHVLEIGGGFGGAARLFKFFIPDVTFYIMDISETLFFAYVYLRANFPEARIKVVLDTNGTNASEDHDYHFILVPVPHMEYLKGGHYDCVINTASLGEMTQVAVDRYIAFIQDDVDTGYFYSVNRYGQFPREPVHIPMQVDCIVNGLPVKTQSAYVLPEEAKNQAGHYCYADGQCFYMWEDASRTAVFRPYRTAGGNACDYSTPLDPYWKTRLWRLRDQDSFSAIEYMAPPSLELLVERVPKASIPGEQLKFLSKNLFDEAMRRSSKDSQWEYLMWESVRLDPSKNNLPVWLEYLQSSRYDEYIYFKKLLDNLS